MSIAVSIKDRVERQLACNASSAEDASANVCGELAAIKDTRKWSQFSYFVGAKSKVHAMKNIAKWILVGLISMVGMLIMLGGIDRYLFTKRISAADPKALYYNVKSVIAQAQMQSSGVVLSGTADAAEFGSYRVVLATDRLVILYTASATSSAYLAFNRIGNSNAWAVGWLRGARLSQIGTFRF